MSIRARMSPRNDPGGEGKAFDLEEIPSFFLATDGEEVHDAMMDDGADIRKVFKGYNALQWHCDAPSTSPSLIWALIEYGIEINALDQHKLPANSGAGHPPITRRTALGYACRNANVKAVRTLLKLGANPLGNLSSLETPFDLLQLRGQQNPTARPNYPSPTQDLFSKRIGGPTGACPFSFHLNMRIAEADDNDDDVPRSYHQLLHGRSYRYGSGAPRPKCTRCSFGFDVAVAARLDAAGRASQAARAEDIYAAQVELASMRVVKCSKLLLEYMEDDQLSQGHDTALLSPMDCLLCSVWHFLGPTMLCWRKRFAQRFYGLDTATLTRRELVHFIAQEPSVTALDLEPWADIVVHAMAASPLRPYRSQTGEPAVSLNIITEKQGVDRLLAILETHPSLDQFQEGQYADVTFGMLPGRLLKPLQQSNDTSSDEEEEEASDEEEEVASDEEEASDEEGAARVDNGDGSDIVTVCDGNGDPCQLPREVYEEYRRGGYKFAR